jgi:hypothetical protein
MNDSHAHQYAETIAAELVALDDVLQGPPDDEAAAATYRAALDQLEWSHDTDPADALMGYLNETCLDVSIRRDIRGSDYEATIELLRTCGGPRCDIRRDTYDGAALTVEVFYGSDQATRRIYLPTLAEALDQLADDMAAA